MIVYGDRERVASAAAVGECIARQVDEAERAEAVRDREPRIAELAIACGMYVQALLDREFEELGMDELSPLSSAGAALCHAAGCAFVGGPLADVRSALVELARHVTDANLRLREPEGYAFYALYPDLYVAAARALPQRLPERQVIGIRSIGTSLAGFVSGALGCARMPLTVRPLGHPFGRELRIGARLAQALLTRADLTQYLIVDEGPGLSGSSFVAVTEWLIAHGVERAQIALLPSHANAPGAKSSPAVASSYLRTERAFVSFEQHFDKSRLARWFSDVTGALSQPVRDLSGGAWRELLFGDAVVQPPSNRRDERRKYLLQNDGQRWLMKFIGLGAGARELNARARLLSEYDFTPELVCTRHGFALWRWRDDATPLPLAEYVRADLVAHVAHYLAFLAERCRTREPERGALPSQLLQLAKYNIGELLGPAHADALCRFDAQLPALSAAHVATATDNKLDAYEWLLLPSGEWLKADAEAHHAAHDCIGCQDPAWDVAGATLELDFSDAERELVLRALRDRAGLALTSDKLRFYELAYAAFRAGSAHYAELGLRGWADVDAARFSSEKARYTRAIAQRLET
jgi:hypothetical protein